MALHASHHGVTATGTGGSRDVVGGMIRAEPMLSADGGVGTGGSNCLTLPVSDRMGGSRPPAALATPQVYS